MDRLTDRLHPDSVLTAEAEKFLAEWSNPLPYVTASTSGSTGTPKKIRLLKSDMSASAKATVKFFGLNNESVLHLPLSPDYIAGKMQIIRAIEAGCRIITETPSNQPSLCSSVASDINSEISLLPIVPSQIDAVLSSPRLLTIKALIVGGAPISDDAERRIIKTGINAFATYGMTETCSHVALRKLGCESFNALPGFTFSTDPRGCLVISSSTLSFSSLTTNDIVRLSSPTSFRWIGRYDNVINSGGIKIYPEEIEKEISPMVDSDIKFYVTSRKSPRWGEEAVIVTDSPNFPENVINVIKDQIGSKRSPKDIIYDPDFKLTSSQKIIRRKF